MHIVRLVSRLFKLFIPSFIANVAKSSGFMKQHSKLLPDTFAKAMSLGLLDSKNITEDQTFRCNNHFITRASC